MKNLPIILTIGITFILFLMVYIMGWIFIWEIMIPVHIVLFFYILWEIKRAPVIKN